MRRILEFLKQHSNYLIIGLYIVLGFVLYANSFHNQMFWDDNDGIINNAYIKDWHNFPKFFSENLIAGSNLVSNYWRPLLLTVFSLEWHFWQDSVLGYHIVNTIFHILCSIFIYFILKRLFQSRILAFIPGLIFLIHPLQTEAITYVSGLADPLSAFFVLSGIWFYLNYRDSDEKKSDSAPYILAVVMYILALMTKDSTVIMPGLIAIVDFFYKPQNFPLKDRLINTFRNTYSFFITAAVYTLLRATSLNFQNTFNLYNEENVYTSNFHVRLFTFFKVITTYLQLLVWPNHLHMERSIELARSFFSASVIFGALIFFGSIILAVIWRNKYPILSFGILWFFILLFPHSNLLVPTAGLLYEHWLYLPMVGFWLIVAWLIPDKKPYFRIPAIAVMTILFFIFSHKTLARNRDWHDPITFYNQTLSYAPTSYRIINNLGMAYDEDKNYEQAEQMYRRAIALDPDVPVAYHNLGNTYKELGKLDLAEAEFKTAIAKDPRFIFSYNALAQLYLSQNKRDEARKILEAYPKER